MCVSRDVVIELFVSGNGFGWLRAMMSFEQEFGAGIAAGTVRGMGSATATGLCAILLPLYHLPHYNIASMLFQFDFLMSSASKVIAEFSGRGFK
jgi:hypothetical protein